VRKSEILGLAGSSGSGKSTLLRCIQKLDVPDSGEIKCDCKVGFMFQDFQLFPHMTVLQNLVYAPSLKRKKDKEQFVDQAMDMLKSLGMESKASEYPKTLSGGQKQRAALVRSLMTKPDILLCDEPTSGLDVATIIDVVSLLKSINELGVTLIIASHDLDFLTKIANRVVLIKKGKIAVDVELSKQTDPVSYLREYY
jgi:polar amino acid transport system ATP-binding protein